MACRLPGADGLEAFWDLVVNGRTAWGRLPESRFSRDLYFDPEKGTVGKSYSELGGLVSDRPADPTVCPIQPEMLGRYDVAHQIFLEVASLACRDAGLDPFAMPSNRRTGVYVGHTGGSTRIGDYVYSTGIDGTAVWLSEVEAARELLGSDVAAVAREITDGVRRDHPGRRPGQSLDLAALGAAQIVNEALRLEGPYLVVDAACASAMQALAIAARALREGGIEQAIVGGASYCKSDSLVLFSAAQSVSNTGSCPFGRDADGLVTAEGYVALVLKTLSKAIDDGDRIRAVIRGIGVASDGKGKSLWAPRQEGQKLAVERAYPDAREIGRLDYIEAHATSTQVGDATELGALSSLMATHLAPGKKIPIGSVKANIGHTLETAGMASLVKVVLAMEHGIIPPGSTCTDCNDEFDWVNGPFSVPREPIAWPKRADGQARRAAVNAFGIGGLNVHLAIAEHVPLGGSDVRSPRRPAAESGDDTAVAIVGMGGILPGALTLEKFHQLLEGGESAIGPVPPERWDASRALDPSGPRTWHTTAAFGGFIRGFAYDWRRHKVPPKQIAAANPLQFMLLEAADAALAEVGGVAALDRIRTAVVVGTMFGGEFAHDLQMGLRLPETSGHLRAALERRGIPARDADRIVQAYGKKLLERMPALVDETGSFTSSTLASRLTKTFDLMGGALALDAGDCSGASALSAAVDMLRQKDCDAVVCAAGQRCLDLMAFEGWSLGKALADGPTTPFSGSRRGRVPGEGAVVFLLKRLADARAAGNRIHGVIRGVAIATGRSAPAALRRVARAARLQAGISATGVTAVEVSGTGVPDVDAAQIQMLSDEYGGRPVAGAIEGVLGNVGAAAMAAGIVKMTRVLSRGEMPPTVAAGQAAGPMRVSGSRSVTVPAVDPDGYRAGGITVLHGNQAAHVVMDNGLPVPDAVRETASSVTAVNTAPTRRPERGLVAAIFPGQGSQYTDMFRGLVADSAHARQCLDKLDAAARAAGCETLAEIAWKPTNGLGTVVWDTQWAMYLGDLFAWGVLERMGFSPDVIASHSFGEFPSLVAAGAWHIADGARATRARASAVEELGPKHGAMLSVIAGRDEVAAAIAPFAGQVWTCAENAPEQSVIGGHARVVDAVEILLEGRRIRSKRLAVPCPFHTPLLAAAADRLAQDIEGLPIVAPTRRVYSSTTAAAMTSAEEVRQSLVRQMTQTVRWVDVVEKLWADGVRTFVEVGPSGVLSGLTRRILEGRDGATFIQFDQRGRDAAGHLEKVRESLAAAGALAPSQTAATPPGVSAGGVLSFDATARRRARNRAGSAPIRPAAPVASGDRVASQAGEDKRSARTDGDRAAPVRMASPNAAAESPTASTAVPPTNRLARVSSPASAPAAQRGSTLEQTVAELIREYDVVLPIGSMPDQGEEFLDAARHLFACGPESAAALRRAASPRELCEILARSGGKANWVDRAPLAGADEKSVPAPAVASGSLELENFLVDFVVEQTGYPKEIVELDADLEGDLGIDSIRKAQLFGEIGQKYGLTADASVSLDDFRTLRHLLDYMVPRVGVRAGAVADVGSPAVVARNGHASPGGRDSAQGAYEANGHGSYGSHGHALNGHGLNGHALNGHGLNGHALNDAGKPATAEAGTALLDTVAAAGDGAAGLETFLVDFVVEQTGYPREIVELDADLEGDLGIDSIRKAQLFGEIGQKYGLTADASVSLDDFRTLRHLLDYMVPRVGVRAGAVAEVGSPAVVARNGHASPVGHGSAPGVYEANGHDSHGSHGHALNGHGLNGHALNGAGKPATAGAGTAPLDAVAAAADGVAELETFLVDFVVEQTGYPREIVELDADLEGDLGIDSIRKAQLFGEIGQKYGLTADASVSLDDFRTLRHLLDYMVPRVCGSAMNAPARPALAVSAEDAAAIRLWAREMARAGGQAGHAVAPIRLPADAAALVESTAAAVGVDAAVLLAALGNPAAALGGCDVAVVADHDGRSGMAVGFGRHAAPATKSFSADGVSGFLVGLVGLPGGILAWNDAGLLVVARPTPDRAAGAIPVMCAVERIAHCRTVDEAEAAARAMAPLAGGVLLMSVAGGAVRELGADGRLGESVPEWYGCAAVSPLVRVAGNNAGGVAVDRILTDAAGVGVRDGLSATCTWLAGGAVHGAAVAFAGGPGGQWLPSTAVESLASVWRPVADRQAGAAGAGGSEVTGRFGLSMAALPESPRDRSLVGERVLILAGVDSAGRDLTRQLTDFFTARGAESHVVVATSVGDVEAAIDAAESRAAVRHLVITTPFAAAADWVAAREPLLAAGYFACQRWLATRARSGDTGRSTLTAVTALGGDFGLSGAIGSAVGGGFAGLLKGLAREYPDVQIRVVDFAAGTPAAEVGARVVDEIQRSGPVEVGWQGERRQTVVAVERKPLSAGKLASLARGSVWLVTGGARGVTAACARALGAGHGLRLVLVGSTRPIAVEEAWLTLDEAGLKSLKGRVMLDAKAAGSDPRQTWREVEKSIEISRELAKFRAAGVSIRYECCDLGDAVAVRELVHRVERETGTIRGLVHGAGWESACKFEKKTAAGLESTLGPKCVGLENVLAAVDPRTLESVVAFGSTSGRLGGLGQADYSLANDMLAKIVGRLRQQRPHVRATVFHWHAWDEVGMASRPESRFVLEQFGMKFMPLAEGVGRFLAELEAGLPEAEVLVTERVFCLDGAAAAGTAPVTAGAPAGMRSGPAPSLVAAVEAGSDSASVRFRLDPSVDRFLVDHLQFGRPLLPAVMGAELLAQAAIGSGRCDRVGEIRGFAIERPVAFPVNASRTVRVEVTAGQPAIEARGYATVTNSDGQAGEEERLHFHGVVIPGEAEPIAARMSEPPFPYYPSAYPDEAPMWHGPSLRTLTGLFLDRSGGWARLQAFDENAAAQPRGADGWTLPIALLDGCIVACGFYSHVMCGQRVEIPVGFERLRLVSKPRIDETCTARLLFRDQDPKVTVYDLVVFGADGRPLLAVDGLQLASMAPERSRSR